VPYAVDASRVASEVARFSESQRAAWETCLAEIALDPFPRYGFYVDRAIPIPGFTFRTWLYDITEETSVSGEVVNVFNAEFFPDYAPVYIVDEAVNEVLLLFLRENRRA
jgi:hypothetical protein